MTIKEMRIATGRTQREIAESLGVTRMCYFNWEKGRSIPQPRYINPLARELKVSPSAVVKVLFLKGE